jgi:cytosine deaminase
MRSTHGDHDMLEVFRGPLASPPDRPHGDWPRAVTTTPADLMGLGDAGRIGVGQPADLVLFRGRDFSELVPAAGGPGDTPRWPARRAAPSGHRA